MEEEETMSGEKRRAELWFRDPVWLCSGEFGDEDWRRWRMEEEGRRDFAAHGERRWGRETMSGERGKLVS